MPVPQCSEALLLRRVSLETPARAVGVGWGESGRAHGRLVLGPDSISWFLAMHALTSRAEQFLLIESSPEKPDSLIYEGQCN